MGARTVLTHASLPPIMRALPLPVAEVGVADPGADRLAHRCSNANQSALTPCTVQLVGMLPRPASASAGCGHNPGDEACAKAGIDKISARLK
jgi:hypothetical protein